MMKGDTRAGKELRKAENWFNNMDPKHKSSASSFKQYQHY